VLGWSGFIDPTHRVRQRRDGWGTRTPYARASRYIDPITQGELSCVTGDVNGGKAL
jgi:hypothetical protein